MRDKCANINRSGLGKLWTKKNYNFECKCGLFWSFAFILNTFSRKARCLGTNKKTNRRLSGDNDGLVNSNDNIHNALAGQITLTNCPHRASSITTSNGESTRSHYVNDGYL